MGELRKQAEALARRSYDIQVLCLPCDNQNGRCLYKVRSPELGYEAVRKTIPEALDLIRVVRVEYIYGLLEEGRPVPDPDPVFGPRPRGEDVREVAYEMVHAACLKRRLIR